jgi:hypothetical protein
VEREPDPRAQAIPREVFALSTGVKFGAADSGRF